MGIEHVAAGLDIGSTNLKALAITREGRIIGRACLPTPRRTADRMIDARILVTEATSLLGQICGTDYRIAAIASAGIGEDGMLVDPSLAPLTPALPWFDTQRHALFKRFASRLPPCDAAGIVADPFRTLTGWYWARQQPGHERARHWLAVTDYAACYWSGRPFISDTIAARSAAFLPRTRRWADDRVALTLGNMAWLPPVLPTGSVVGPVRHPEPGVSSPFTTEAVVVAGGHDHPVGGWGITQINANAILDSMGTAEVVAMQMPEYPATEISAFDFAPGILSQGATVMRVEELARNLAWASEDEATGNAIKALFSGALTPDSCLDETYFMPGGHGGYAPAYAPSLPDSPLSRASAVTGALARIGNQAVERLAALRDTPSPLYVSGGWSRAPGWIAIKRRFSSRAFDVVREPELTAASAALLAARAIGWAPDVPALLMPG